MKRAALILLLVACRPPASPRVAAAPAASALVNRFAYLPPQCYTRTAGGHNPCYVCHQRARAPNYNDDSALQLTLRLPAGAASNPWRNLFDPPVLRARRLPDAEVLSYVRRSNYFDPAGGIVLRARLAALPAAWDTDGDHRWDGFTPDAWFHFDERGFDHRPDGAATGWRAFSYYPFPGTFFPTNGSIDDVLIRLEPRMQRDARGRVDQRVYEANLAIVEALIARADVAIDQTDERALNADLDLDGRLGRARRVTFAPARMRWVGQARDAGDLPLAAGLLPLGTELLHSVRYLDVDHGQVAMAPRMKELRYSRKARWLSERDLAARAASDSVEENEAGGLAREILWEHDRGVYNGQGWLLQGFIEAADGSLRPQSYEETAACAGCHGGIGATTDSTFSLARKLGAGAPARGWFHPSQRDLRGIPAGPGDEYATYLAENGAGDELRENREVLARFFRAGKLRPEALDGLRADVSTLLLPSPQRALDLDRAYQAIVREQSFTRGRDAVMAPAENVFEVAPVGQPTGIAAIFPEAAEPRP